MARQFRKLDPVTGEQQDPLGTLGTLPKIAEPIRNPTSWLSLFGVVGIIIAFGHSILAMSGEETLAQVYREVESPKLPNFKKVGVHRFCLQPAADGQHEFSGRDADSRQGADDHVLRQLDGRPGDAHGRPGVAAAAAECVCRVRRLS